MSNLHNKIKREWGMGYRVEIRVKQLIPTKLMHIYQMNGDLNRLVDNNYEYKYSGRN